MVASTTYSASKRWSVCSGIHWSISTGIGGQLKTESGGQIQRNLHLDKGIAAEMFPVIGAMKEVTTSAGKKADLAGVGETNLQVAGIKIKAPNTTVTDFAPFTKILGEPVYGLLGYDLLKEHLVELDLKNMRLNIYSGAQIKVKNTLQLPIDFYKNTPIVEMSLYGGSKAFKGRFMLDTGADGEVFINTYGGFKSRLLEALRQPKTETALDIAGNYSERISGTIDSLNLGGLQMLKPELQIEKNKRIQWSDIDGMIGLDLIKKCNIWFNYPNRRILIEQNYKQ
jgi:hypothetical protein